MTREEKLYSMTMKMLIIEAEKVGVKIDKKGAKEKAVNKILAAEAAKAAAQEPKTEEAPAPEETKEEEKPVEVEEVQEPAPVEEVQPQEEPEETKEEAPAPQEPKKRTKKERKAPAENMFDYAAVILNAFDVDYVISASGKDLRVSKDGEKVFELRRRAARVRVLIGDEGLARINPDLYTDDGGPGLSKKLNHSIYVDKENIMVVINSILA